MMTDEELRPVFERALDDAGAWVLQAAEADLTVGTPCADWDLAALIGHMVGQNEGFAEAVSAGDAPASAYAAPALGRDEIAPRWRASAKRLRGAFRAAPAGAAVRLAELDVEVPLAIALAMQLVDNAVHAWDVATALGEEYRPDGEVVGVVHASAQVVAGNAEGTPGVFAAPRPTTGTDDWSDALRLLGR
ncbi:MAG TPA: TIGR03086 family metal-binding protein [Nocardioides sp.]|nr:TIGR03086 family metal-binding protein [Nocardioides sp.]